LSTNFVSARANRRRAVDSAYLTRS